MPSKIPSHHRQIFFRGETKSLGRWAADLGIPKATLQSRLDLLGWSVERALTTKVDKRRRRGGRPINGMPRACPEPRRDARGRAFVRWKRLGRSFTRYLGKWGSDAARVAYVRFQTEWANGVASAANDGNTLTVPGLYSAYHDWAQTYYVKRGRPTSELTLIKGAGRLLVEACGDSLVSRVNAEHVRAAQAIGVAKGLSRSTINRYVSRIVRIFGWGATRLDTAGVPLVSAGVYGSLKLVESLRRGRTAAPDLPPVESVSWANVAAVFPYLYPSSEPRRQLVEALVRVHWLTGMRPTELLVMRPRDLCNLAGGVVRYLVPSEYDKTGRVRPHSYYLGPQASAILAPILSACPKDRPVFSLPPTTRGGWASIDRRRYLLLVRMACQRAGVPTWHPHQLRHSKATAVGRVYGTAGAAATLGNSPEVAGRVYVDPDEDLRRKIAIEMG